MADAIELKAEIRTAVRVGVKALRRSGKVPAVVYGHKITPTHIQLDAREVTGVLRHAGRNRLITLTVSDVPNPKMVLAREVQRDPIKGTLKHIDFYEVSMTEKITADVSIVCVGESQDVKTGAGVLLQEMDVLAIRCLPGDLIERITIDVSGLAIDQMIRVRDLPVPAAIEVMDEPDEEVVRVTRFVEVKEEEVVVTEAPEVEVIEKGKKEEEEAEAE
ncbi:MAG: 50S ribosomal protein L25 [Chloroflexi bacterium]|nr:50S ribosomal protein L25 [Chloroflexota bacterium]MCL5273459.1 50S ribosomal protein L25 [Chloroflexota bacterium]